MINLPLSCVRVHRLFSLRLIIFVALLISTFCWDGRAPVGAVQNVGLVVTVSAASYARTVAPDSIVAAFGTGFVPAGTELAGGDTNPATPEIELPTLLGDISVEVNGRSASLFFVSGRQVNFVVPPGLDPGTGSVIIKHISGRIIASGEIEIQLAVPSIFTANSSGQGPPAALVYSFKTDGTVTIEDAFVYAPAEGRFVPRPIDLGPLGERVFVALFLTGVRRVGDPKESRLLLGGSEFIPDFIGPAPGFVGLEQVNFELPRFLSGRLAFALAALGYATSNICELEIAPPADAPPRIITLSKASVLAGESIEITGSGFAQTPSDNVITVVDQNRKEFNAKVEEASTTSLKLMIPYGAGSGSIAVRTERGRIEYPLTMRTSVSGVVQTAQLQPDGSVKRSGVKNVTVSIVTPTGPPIATTTSADGSFLLPDVPSSTVAFLDIDGRPTGLNYPIQRIKTRVDAGRDNQFQGYIEIRQITGTNILANENGALPQLSFTAESEVDQAQTACSGQNRQVVFEPNGSTVQFPDGTSVNSIAVTVLDAGRTPVDLPPGQFSSTVVQLTPFGARLNPGGKLTFPNCDGLPASSTATLYRFDQTPGSTTLGQVVAAGSATVSADGVRIETSPNAIKETTYYFVSVPRQTTTIYGSVVEEDSQPARGALVQVSGQSIFALTDQNGAFILLNVPMVGASMFTIEVSFLRPDGTVDRTERIGVRPGAGGLTFVSPPIVLTGQGRTRAPVILSPKSLTVEAGKTADFTFLAYARVAGATLQPVTVIGASFASVIGIGSDRYTLHLTPGTSAAGNYTLIITATDSDGRTTSETIALEVKAPASNVPVANSQTVVTNEDTPVNIVLTSTGGSAYRITVPPVNGNLSGTAPALVYTPRENFSGSDSFSFVLGNGTVESAQANVSIAVRPVNDAPRLEAVSGYTTNIGQPLNAVINGFDIDAGQTLMLSATELPTGASITQLTATSWVLSWTPGFGQLGSYNVSLTLKDNGVPQLSAERTITIGVEAKWAQTSGPEGAHITAFAKLGNTLFAGTDSINSHGVGVYRSTDQGVSWHRANNGLVDRYVIALVVSGSSVFAGTLNGGVFRTTDFGTSWIKVNNGLGSLRVFDLASSGNMVFVATTAGVYRTTDQGTSWQHANAGIPPFFVNAALLVNGNLILAGIPGRGVFRSTDFGANWTHTNITLTPTEVVSSFVVSGSSILANTQDNVYRTSNQGANWTLVSHPVHSISMLAADGNMVFAATSGGVYRTADLGASWISIGLTGVSVQTLLVSGTTIFASSIARQVYRSTDGGITWSSSNAGLVDLHVRALLINGNTVFAGTQGSGLYRTTDQGASWTALNLINMPDVTSLVVNENIIFTGGSGKVFRSSDNGTNWTEVINGLPLYPVHALYVAGGAVFVGTGVGVWRTTDQGANWIGMNNGLPVVSGFGPVVRAFTANGNSVFASIQNSGVFRTDNQGATWTQVNNGLTNLVVPALASSGNTVLAGTSGGGLFRSTNLGTSWTPANDGLTTAYVHAFAVSNNATFVATNDGVFRTTDQGGKWSQIVDSLINREVSALAAGGNTIFAGTFADPVMRLAELSEFWSEGNVGLTNRFTQSATVSGAVLLIGTFNGGVFRSIDEGQTWAPSNTGLPPAAEVRTLTTTSGGTFAGLAGSGVFFSSDQGLSWTPRSSGLGSLQINALATDGMILWAGTDGGVFRSTNDGQSWTAVNSGLEPLRVLSLTLSGSELFAGTENGLYRSTNQGNLWVAANTGLTNLYIASLGAAPDGTTVLAGTSNGLYRSVNRGATWTKITAGIPEQVVTLTFALSGTKLLAGTVNGFFVSDDNGISWQQINGGLLNLQVGALATKGNLVLAGTRSGGVFTSQLGQ